MVLPGLVEGHPLAPLEVFAMGKGVILPDRSSSYEIVNNGIDEFIVPHDDECNWAESTLFSHHIEMYLEVTENRARIKIQSKFNHEINLDIMELLCSCLYLKATTVNRLADHQ
jgi:hypothetical protein